MNGDYISVQPGVKFLIESDDIWYVSPAVLSRVKLISIDKDMIDDLELIDILNTWIPHYFWKYMPIIWIFF